jgi:ADP-ribose pyrophosphatase YjhB (NUDIX family)
MADYIQWLRGQIGPALVPLAYATAIIQDEAGRVLFQRRADFADAWWGLPGGLLDPGETPEACARREVREETGLRVVAARLTGLYSSPRYAVTYPNGHQAQQVTFCYACQVSAGRLSPQASEILELKFFALDALPPRPVWYADMLTHHLAAPPTPFFDPPEQSPLTTPYATLLDLRQRVGSAPLIWPGASAAVFDDDGRLLFQRRGDDGQWGLPAGALDVGETLAHTAVRETREETGLEVEPLHLISAYGGHRLTLPNGHILWPVGGLFACRWLSGRPQADGAESTAVRFFARHDLPPLAPHVRERVDAAFRTSPGRL